MIPYSRHLLSMMNKFVRDVWHPFFEYDRNFSPVVLRKTGRKPVIS